MLAKVLWESILSPQTLDMVPVLRDRASGRDLSSSACQSPVPSPASAARLPSLGPSENSAWKEASSYSSVSDPCKIMTQLGDELLVLKLLEGKFSSKPEKRRWGQIGSFLLLMLNSPP